MGDRGPARQGKKVVIFGTGDFARTAHVYLRQDSPHDVVAFTVHAEHRAAETLHGLDVVPFETLAERYPPGEFAMLVAIGYKRVNQARAEVYAACKAQGYELITYINSTVACWGDVAIGDNCFIFEENVLQPFVTIGNDVVLWSGNHVGHDTRIGDHCFIASHAVISGRVTIGAYSFVGVNTTFRDHVTVGAHSVIGAGAVILKDTAEYSVHAARHTPALELRSDELKSFR